MAKNIEGNSFPILNNLKKLIMRRCYNFTDEGMEKLCKNLNLTNCNYYFKFFFKN